MSYFRFEEEIDFGKGKGRLNDESIKKKTQKLLEERTQTFWNHGRLTAIFCFPLLQEIFNET